jgi:tetratricopeptide (TPR) repeat protein
MSDKPTTRMDTILEMLAATPNDSDLHYMLAMEYKSLGRTEDVATQLIKLVETVNPDNSPAYLQLGQALEKLNRIEEARKYLTRGIMVAENRKDWHAAEEMKELLSSLE